MATKATTTRRKPKKTYQRKTDPDLADIAYGRTRGRPRKADSEVTSEILATGEATMAQIAQMFNTDAKTLPKRMRGILPKGTRRGYKVYSIAEAATRIVTPGYEIEEFIRQMSPQELPSHLLKEFWAGQKSRAEYEKMIGNLWETGKVVEIVAEQQNITRMTLLLFADDVHREQKLTDGQRAIIQRMVDALIVTLGDKIEERFKEYHDNRAEEIPLYDDGDDDDSEDDGLSDIEGEDDTADVFDDFSQAETDEEEDIDI